MKLNQQGRRCRPCRSLAHPARRTPGMENNRFGHPGPVAQEGIHIRPRPPRQVRDLHGRKLGRGCAPRGKDVHV